MPHAKGLGRHRKEKALASKLDQLHVMTTVVADTGDLGAVACLKPVRLHDESHDRPERCRHSRVQGCCRRSIGMGTRAERRLYTRRRRDWRPARSLRWSRAVAACAGRQPVLQCRSIGREGPPDHRRLQTERRRARARLVKARG